MNKKLIAYGLSALLALPTIAFAFTPPPQPNTNVSLNIDDLIGIILTIFWSIVVAIVIILFILAGFLFITAQGDPGKIAQGRQAVIWGIVGIAVILLSYAIIGIVRNQFGL